MNELLANFDINGVWIISSFPEKGVMSNCLRFRLVFFLIFCHSAILFGQSYNGNYTKVTGGNWNAGSTWILGSAPAPFSGTTAQPVYIKNNINLNIDELLINEGVYVIGSFGDNKITGGVYNYFKPSGGSNTFFDSRIYYCQDPSKNNCTATLPSGILSGDVLQYNGNLQSVGSFDQTTDPNNKFYNACPVSNFYTAKSNTGENDFSKTWTVNESVTTTKSAIPLPSAGSNAFTYPSTNGIQVVDQVFPIASLKNWVSSASDPPGEFKFLTIKAFKSGETLESYRGIIDIRSNNTGPINTHPGTVVNFEGGAFLNDGAKLIVRSGSTLVLGPSSCAVCEQTGTLTGSQPSAIYWPQPSAQTTWNIPNLSGANLIDRPAVTAISTAGVRIFPTAVVLSASKDFINVTFPSAVSGYAIVRSFSYVLNPSDNLLETERAVLCSSNNTPCTRTRLQLSGSSKILVEPNAEIKIYGNVNDVVQGNNNEINLRGLINIIGDYLVTNTNIQTAFLLPNNAVLSSGTCSPIVRGTLTTTGIMVTGNVKSIYNIIKDCPSVSSNLSTGCSSDDLGCADFSLATLPSGIVTVCGQPVEISGIKNQTKTAPNSSTYSWDLTWEGSNDLSNNYTPIVYDAANAALSYLTTGGTYATTINNPISLNNAFYDAVASQTLGKITVGSGFPSKYLRLKVRGYYVKNGVTTSCTDVTQPINIQASGSSPGNGYKIWIGRNSSTNPLGDIDWFTSANWCPAGVPDLNSNVFLAPGDLVTIGINSVGGARVNSLIVSGNSQSITGPAQLTILNATNGLIVNGVLNVNSGSNSIPVGGKITSSGTTLSFNDAITNYGTLTANSGTLNFAGSIINYGTIHNFGSSTFRFTGGTLTSPSLINNLGDFLATDYQVDPPVNNLNAYVYFLGYTQIVNDPNAILSFSRLNVGISGGASGYLKINPGSTVKITTSISMPSGKSTFIGDGSTFEFPTTSYSQIIQIDADNQKFGNILIDRLTNPDPPKVNLFRPIKVSGKISLKEGLLLTNNSNLTLLSEGDVNSSGGDIGNLTSGDAQITQFGTYGYISGNVTIQRKLDPLTGSPPEHYYRYLGSAVSTTPSSITSDPVTGTNPYIKMLDSLYNPITPTSKIRPGKGFVYNSGSGETISLSGSLHGSLIPLYSNTIQATQGGDKTWGPFSTTGWKLIGNPYPSSIEWNYSDWSQSSTGSVASIMAISDAHVSGAYPAYFRYADNTAPSWGSGYVQNNVIAMGQGFWVYVQTPGATLTVTENAKTSTLGKFYRNGSGGNNPFDELQISLQDQFAADHIFLRTPNQNSSEQQLDTRDIGKLYNPNLNVYFSEGTNGALLIKYLAGDLKDISIPLGIDAKGAGTYTLRFEFSDYAPEGLKNLYLIDKIAGTSTMVSSQSIYSFDFPDASKPSEDRFILSSRPYIPAKEIEEFQVYPNPVSGQLTMKFPESLTVQTTIYSIRGELIYQDISSGGCVFDFGPLPSGIYLVNFKSERGNITRKIIRE